MTVNPHPRPNVPFRDLTNILLKPERPARFSLEEGLAVLLSFAIIAAVALAWVWWG